LREAVAGIVAPRRSRASVPPARLESTASILGRRLHGRPLPLAMACSRSVTSEVERRIGRLRQ
jgi:hypothetical protein